MAAGSKERLIKIIGTKDSAKEQRPPLAFLLWSLGRDARRISRMRLGPWVPLNPSLPVLPALACGSGSEADPE